MRICNHPINPSRELLFNLRDMLSYGDKTYCISKVKVHTCGREFTDEDKKNAEKWWGGKDFPVAYSDFCEEIEEVQVHNVTITKTI